MENNGIILNELKTKNKKENDLVIDDFSDS